MLPLGGASYIPVNNKMQQCRINCTETNGDPGPHKEDGATNLEKNVFFFI